MASIDLGGIPYMGNVPVQALYLGSDLIWSSTPPDPIPGLTPYSYYKLNGNTDDVMGRANLGVSSTRATLGAEYLTFNNVTGSNYVNITGLPAGATSGVGNAYTVCMWVYPTQINEYTNFLGRGTGSTNSIDLYYGTDTKYNIATFPASGATINGAYALNEWQHLVFRITHSGTSSTTGQIWRNGVSLGTGSVSRNTRHSSADPLRIGSGAQGDYPFVGHMDTLVYFTRALNNTEVQTIYNAGRR